MTYWNLEFWKTIPVSLNSPIRIYMYKTRKNSYCKNFNCAGVFYKKFAIIFKQMIPVWVFYDEGYTDPFVIHILSRVLEFVCLDYPISPVQCQVPWSSFPVMFQGHQRFSPSRENANYKTAILWNTKNYFQLNILPVQCTNWNTRKRY